MTAKTIVIPDNFDSANAFDFRDKIDENTESVIIDFRNTLFMDSAGLGTLVFWVRTVQKSGEALTIVNLSGQPKDLIKVVGLDKVVEIHD